ncbi:autotransporter domain-containing protein, partial [Ensifer sp. YR511]|uniref:autotransporter outer membrane beta-barrel domain-containing protein n=1 Tax=Ensifer sp. YR511 TaxID=1855294 RepID=UPI00088172A6
NNAALTFDQGTAGTFAGVISGTGALTKSGAGALTLTGNSSAYAGITDIAAGHLTVNGSLAGAVNVTGGTLGGSGTLAGNVSVTNGTIAAGNSPGTLTIGGDLTLASGSSLNFELGSPLGVAGVDSDLINVGGNLTFDGTLNVSDADGFGAGLYRLVNYGGSLTDNGLDIGAGPSGFNNTNLTVQTATANQVNLLVDAPVGPSSFFFWDGANTTANNTVDGGASTWTATGTNWTIADGSFNGAFDPSVLLIFAGAPGTVTVDESAGAIAIQNGMQFAVDRYSVTGDAVGLTGATVIRVGDGTAAGAGFTATIASNLTGAGSLNKTDRGTLVLTGANTYTGGTTISAGTLIGNVQSIRGDIENAGTVVFDQAAVGSFAGSISGLNGTSGVMVKRGVGDLTLAGTSSLDWTIETGVLTTATGRFSGNASILSGGRLTFDQASAGTYAGVLSGSGAFDLTGSGTVTLTGNSAGFTGTTTVGSGNRLVVGTSAGGALGGSMAIGSGGLLGGTGTIGSLGTTVTITAGAVHAPGNSIGVHTIAGNYANHGALRIEATPAKADKIVVAGTVDITGASLDLVLSPTDASSWNVFNGPFTLIDKQSAGAVVGSFDPVTQNLLFLDTILDYAGGDGNDVTLSLERNDVAFADVGNTRNQIATGAAIETLGNANPLRRSIVLTNDENAVRASFDALSGEIHASAKTALIEDSRFVRNAVNDRIRAAFDGVGASGGTVTTYGDGGPHAAAATTDRFALWGQGFGSWGNTNGDGNAARLNRSTGGFFVGADAPVFDTWRFGVVAGYSSTSFDVKERISSGSGDNYHVGLYGGTTWGDLALRTGVAYTWHDISTWRSVSIPGVSDSLKGDYSAGTTQAFGELGYRAALGSVAFEPFANLAYMSLDTDGFTEKGGVATLSGANRSTDTTFTTLGLRASTPFDLNGASLTAKGMLGWRHAFGDVVPETAMQFGGGNSFTIASVPIARDAAVVEVGLDYAISPSAGFGISYAGQFGDGLADQSFRANFNVKF